MCARATRRRGRSERLRCTCGEVRGTRYEGGVRGLRGRGGRGRIVDMNGTQRRQLYLALLSAFPTLDELRRVARFHLDDAYAQAIEGLALNAAASRLIELAEARGELEMLLRGAEAENPAFPTSMARFAP